MWLCQEPGLKKWCGILLREIVLNKTYQRQKVYGTIRNWGNSPGRDIQKKTKVCPV